MTKPLRRTTTKSSTGNVSHIIKRSKLDVSQLPSTDKVSTSQAIGRYHASKLQNLIHLPKQMHDPTVFYKVGDNMKTETEVIFENSP